MKILVVEGCFNVCIDFILALGVAGYQFEGVFDPRQAEENIDLGKIDGLIIDDQIGWLPLVERLRERGFSGPIITTSLNPEERARQLQNGCSGFIDNKNPNEAVRILKEALTGPEIILD